MISPRIKPSSTKLEKMPSHGPMLAVIGLSHHGSMAFPSDGLPALSQILIVYPERAGLGLFNHLFHDIGKLFFELGVDPAQKSFNHFISSLRSWMSLSKKHSYSSFSDIVINACLIICRFSSGIFPFFIYPP